ncbi:glycoside hydrolase family 18 protein, partial [Candidatus Babeliales bacterium]|nr:glycoside hydrolase family 18 protein [Candidatus Babeliales bacterium]
MKISIFFVSFFLFMLCLTHMLFIHADVCPKPIPNRYSQIQPGNIVAAYFGSWDKYGNYKISDIEPIAPTLTHIIYAFAKPDVQTGTCDLHDPWADVGANFEHRKKAGGHFGELLKLKQKYPHLKILLSIGGGTYSKFFSDIVKAGQVEQFVQSAVMLLDRYEYAYEHSKRGSDHVHVFTYEGLFDGIDLDWEWPGSTVADEDVTNFHTMVFLIAQELKQRTARMGKKSLLSCAIQTHPKIIESL